MTNDEWPDHIAEELRLALADKAVLEKQPVLENSSFVIRH
jgi:hypothetical protein